MSNSAKENYTESTIFPINNDTNDEVVDKINGKMDFKLWLSYVRFHIIKITKVYTGVVCVCVL